MPVAASPGRRPAGWLRDQIRQALAAADRPLSVVDASLRMKTLHPGVHLSAVFRAVNRLVEAGEIDRVELLAGYVVKRAPGAMALICTTCGRYAEVGNAPVEELTELARRVGFTPRRFVVEVTGMCGACSSDRTN